MKTMGFPISTKANEKRRALLPIDVKDVINKKALYFETGYGNVLGFDDQSYLDVGVNICSKEEALCMDIICDPKIGDASYLESLNNGNFIFGWVHAVQNKSVTDIFIKNKNTVFAWEDMYTEGRHVFWRNNEIAGEAAIMHAYQLFGLFPYNTKVAIIGRGNIARGAMKILTLLGADITVYDRKTESLIRKEINKYDVIVNALLWDTSREDHIIYKDDLLLMKQNSMIIDISCDKNGAIETCVPTTLLNPTYMVNGIVHYAVDHTPTIFYKTISSCLSGILPKYINELQSSNYTECLKKSLIIDNGVILDNKIIQFQNRY